MGELVHLGRAEPCQGGRWLSNLYLGCSAVVLVPVMDILEDLCELLSAMDLSRRKVLLQLELSWAVTLWEM